MKIELKEIEVAKLNLQPGDTLLITIKSDEISESLVNSLKYSFSDAFPNNRVMLVGMNPEDNIEFAVVASESQGCGTQSYCADCNCGKKEQYESKV